MKLLSGFIFCFSCLHFLRAEVNPYHMNGELGNHLQTKKIKQFTITKRKSKHDSSDSDTSSSKSSNSSDSSVSSDSNDSSDSSEKSDSSSSSDSNTSSSESDSNSLTSNSSTSISSDSSSDSENSHNTKNTASYNKKIDKIASDINSETIKKISILNSKHSKFAKALKNKKIQNRVIKTLKYIENIGAEELSKKEIHGIEIIASNIKSDEEYVGIMSEVLFLTSNIEKLKNISSDKEKCSYGVLQVTTEDNFKLFAKAAKNKKYRKHPSKIGSLKEQVVYDTMKFWKKFKYRATKKKSVKSYEKIVLILQGKDVDGSKGINCNGTEKGKNRKKIYEKLCEFMEIDPTYD